MRHDSTLRHSSCSMSISKISFFISGWSIVFGRYFQWLICAPVSTTCNHQSQWAPALWVDLRLCCLVLWVWGTHVATHPNLSNQSHELPCGGCITWLILRHERSGFREYLLHQHISHGEIMLVTVHLYLLFVWVELAPLPLQSFTCNLSTPWFVLVSNRDWCKNF